ncbi:MAG: PAS domain S-box protein [Melioribacteraceae bacterium]|nr:PAS domain S-box protein [Melioribacteraceae bacterium]
MNKKIDKISEIFSQEFWILFENSNESISVLNEDGVIVNVNFACKELYKLEEDEITGKKIPDFVYSSFGYDIGKTIIKLKKNEVVTSEIQIFNGDNEVVELRRKEIPIFKDGSLIAIIAYDKDITDRWVSEEIVLLQKEALQATANAIVITNTNGDVIWVNPAFTKLTGYSHEEMIYKNIDLLNSGFHDEDFFDEMQRTVLRGNVWQGEMINKKKDGTTYFEEQTITPVYYKSKDVSFLICVKQDITSRKKAEEQAMLQQEQLIQADKMVALGTLVSGVAHEINNPNNFIMLNAPMLHKAWRGIKPILDEALEGDEGFKVIGMNYPKFQEKFPMMVENILEGSRRINRIVDDLKRFSRKNVDQIFEPVNVNSVVNSSVNLINNLIRKSTKNFELNLYENIPTTIGNYQYLEQIVINFITNACQALPNNEKGIFISTDYNDTDKIIKITVRDEGVGIKKDDLPHITDPFFTTKRGIGGTGLGLSVSSKIIEDLGGKLNFSSIENEGTTAEIILPIKQMK